MSIDNPLEETNEIYFERKAFHLAGNSQEMWVKSNIDLESDAEAQLPKSLAIGFPSPYTMLYQFTVINKLAVFALLLVVSETDRKLVQRCWRFSFLKYFGCQKLNAAQFDEAG